MKTFYFMYFIIIASIVLMIYNISELDFDNLQKGPLAGIVSNVLLILSMLIIIREVKKINKSFNGLDKNLKRAVLIELLKKEINE